MPDEITTSLTAIMIDPPVNFATTKHTALEIANEGQVIVSIGYDGKVHFGPGWTPHAASEEFYNRFAELIAAAAPKV